VSADGTGDEVPVRRQRLAAYAIVLHDDAILLTQLSHRTGWPGGWTLPGGGVDHGEHPRDAVIRETYEETGQRLDDAVLLDVQSEHFVGRAPDGVLEDYHAVRVLYRGSIGRPTDLVIHDVGGTTSDARWVPLAEAGELALVPLAQVAVQRARTE
jgi:8-oxo-dGTP pyrophosphatase MutT (NUDIX family)